MKDTDIIEQITTHARESFDNWRERHTLDNRTPREMYYFGYYEATMQRWEWTEQARREMDEPTTKGIQGRTSAGYEPVSEGHVQKPEDRTTSVIADDGNSRV